jgi:hypothetical protein
VRLTGNWTSDKNARECPAPEIGINAVAFMKLNALRIGYENTFFRYQSVPSEREEITLLQRAA